MEIVELSGQNSAEEDLTIYPFEIRFHLKQGDEFHLGGLTCRVYETPGHTKTRLLISFRRLKPCCGESCGVIQGEKGDHRANTGKFLSSYEDYIDSLNR